jgi:hypothetical protein
VTTATAGTRIYIATSLAPGGSSSSDGPEIIGIRCPAGISGLEDSEAQAVLRDGAVPSWSIGPHIPAQISIPYNFDVRSRSHRALIAMRDARQQASFMVAFGRTSPEPVSTTGGRLVSAGPTTAEFLGKVLKIAYDVQVGDYVRGTLVLVRDSAITWDYPAADRD